MLLDRPIQPSQIAHPQVVSGFNPTMLFPDEFPITRRWPAAHPERLQLVKVVQPPALARLENGFSSLRANARHAQQGYVTDHIPAQALHDGHVDVYLCGPPPMVDAVQKHFKQAAIVPASFHYEKFAASA